MEGGRNCPDLLYFPVSWWVYFRLVLPTWIYQDVNHWFLSSSLQLYYYTGLFIASMLSPSSLTLQAKKNTRLLSWFYGGCNAIAIAIGEQLILVLLSSIIEPTLDCDFAFVSDKKRFHENVFSLWLWHWNANSCCDSKLAKYPKDCLSLMILSYLSFLHFKPFALKEHKTLWPRTVKRLKLL